MNPWNGDTPPQKKTPPPQKKRKKPPSLFEEEIKNAKTAKEGGRQYILFEEACPISNWLGRARSRN